MYTIWKSTSTLKPAPIHVAYLVRGVRDAGGIRGANKSSAGYKGGTRAAWRKGVQWVCSGCVVGVQWVCSGRGALAQEGDDVHDEVEVALGAEQAEVGLALRDRVDEVEHLVESVSRLGSWQVRK